MHGIGETFFASRNISGMKVLRYRYIYRHIAVTAPSHRRYSTVTSPLQHRYISGMKALREGVDNMRALGATSRPATVCGGACNCMWWRLQPYVVEAVTVCGGGCKRWRWRL